MKKVIDVVSDAELAELIEAQNREAYLEVLREYLDDPECSLPIMLFPTGYQPIVVTPPGMDNWAEVIGLLHLALSSESRDLLSASDEGYDDFVEVDGDD